jgi:SAM-dependent methyltransferase
MLDLGTGGGELLESLAPLPSTVFATEGYPPNLDLARERLTPLGVRVLSSGPDLRIPLDDRAVDLVLDRHEEFSGPEVYRVLTPEGWFVTQQVGGRNLLELRQRFGSAETRPTNDVTGASALAAEIARSGLVVHDAQEAVYAGSFRDVGALVYFLRAAPWEVPGFSVTEMRGTLREIHEEIRRSGSFRVTTHRLLVLAQRPA